MKTKKILIIAIMIVSIAILYQINCKENPRIEQERIEFKPDRSKEKIIKSDEKFERVLKEKIPKGILLRFKGRGELVLKPDTTGLRGLFFSFAVRTRNNKEIETNIFLKRKGKKIPIMRVIKKNYYRIISKEIDFKKSDEIIIGLKGEGTVIVNKALVYKIKEKKERKYIFAIALDTTRYDSIGIKRNGVSVTPTIDTLKKDSVVFENTFSQSSWTLPSFTSFFTALYEFNHQITRTTSLMKSKPFLIEQLRKKFLTVNFNSGLWLKGKFGFSRGFDYFDVVSNPLDARGGEVLFSRTIEFLENTRIPDLFMFLHTYQIHSPYTPPEKYIERLNLKVKKKKLDTYFYKKQFLKDFDRGLPEEMKKLYEAELTAFDDFFSKFIKALKNRGIYYQSMIIFFSDHGEEFYEHRGWAHAHSLYNEVIKVPLFIKFPNNLFKGKIITKNVGLIDILPTVIDYFGINNERKIDGLSLMSLIRNNKKWEREKIYSSTSVTWLVKQIQPKFAIIENNKKLIYNFPFSDKNNRFFSEYGLPPEIPKIEVFDLKSDLKEQHRIKGKEMILMREKYRNTIAGIVKKIKLGLNKKRKSNINLSREERKKLFSLGYISQ